MSGTKVYVINIDAQGDIRTVLQRREALGNKIALTARKHGEQAWFHNFEDDMLGGAACILLECSESFMANVRKLPDFASDHPVWENIATKRSPQLQAYYTSPSPGPAPRP